MCGGVVQLVTAGLLVPLTVMGSALLDEDMAELARMIRDTCVEDVGVDEALLERVDGGADLPADDKFKCYLKCTMETAGMMSDGEVDVETVLALAPESIRSRNEGIVRSCDTQHGADDCDTAYRTQVCWQSANKADYIFI